MTDPWLLMLYDRYGECWMVQMNGKAYPLHCGEILEIRNGDKGIPCRLELDRDWYVVMQGARFYLRKKDAYYIHI